ncbi:MAG: tetratricopeptide repeat protein [Ignavibacteria bacterium]
MKIPTGNITLLFTDIEGSTKLSQDFPEKMQAALNTHHSILHKAIETNNGFVFQIIGDAFCCAFENTDDAIKAAADAQIKLSDEEWDETVIRVRMGIHSGNVEWNGKSYMGYITLARTHRVMSAANGGQVIVSNDSYEIAKYKVDPEISFRDLGDRRLKDLIQPLKLFQLISSNLPSDFPPLKTLDARPNNLPVQLTSFIGRENEITDLKKLLSDTKLLTLLGPGGTGKTRLAVQVGADMIDDFENGVWIVELASLIDPNLLTQSVTEALRLKEHSGITPEKLLYDHLKDKKIMIILDNCEHLIDACAVLAEKLLQNCPRLKIMVTSREALRCGGELIHKVLSLSHPDPKIKVEPEILVQYEAVRLFIERAIAVNPGFRVNNDNAAALAQICYQLDGIPLAIELAAVRTKVLSLENICKKLSDRFRLLTGGKRTALPRQQTLRALIDWSYDLLSDKEKILWRRLSVFAGAWTLDAAEEVCSDENLDQEEILDLVNNLTEKSIVLFSGTNDNYKMLETIRQYGDEKLKESGETKSFYTKHLSYYLNLCEGAIPELSGTNAKKWFNKFEEFYPNIQTGLNWSVENNLKEEGLRLAFSMGKFWELRGHFTEGRNWFDKLFTETENVPRDIVANSKGAAGILAIHQGQYDESEILIEDALKIFKETGNQKGIANSLNSLGLNAVDKSDYKKAKEYLYESLKLRREINHRLGICSTSNSLGLLFLIEGDFVNAKKYWEETLEISLEINDSMYEGIAYSNLAQIYDNLGDLQKSKEYFEKGLQLDRELGNKNGICISLFNLGNVAYLSGDYILSRQLYDESLALSKETGYLQATLYALTGLGQTSLAEKEYVIAENIFKESLMLQKNFIDLQCSVISIIGIAEIKDHNGQSELAATLISGVKCKYESVGAFFDKNLQSQSDVIMNSVIKQIGEAKTEAAVEKGKTMLYEKIIELAQEDNP